MTEQPLVSVGLPTFNRASTLRRAIESVLTQDYQNIELIISDNASADETEAICMEICAGDCRVKYFRKPDNQGALANFREVLERSAGEFFMWLGDDDWLDPSYIARCMEVLTKHPDYALVCGGAKYYQDDRLEFKGELINLPQPSGAERVLAYFDCVRHNGVFYGVMRRAQILRMPMRNRLGGDWLLIGAIAFMGKIKTLEDIYVHRNLGGATVSFEKMATSLGLSSFAVNHPNFDVAASALSDIVWYSPVYSKGGLFSRLWLGCRIFVMVADRGPTLFGRNAYSQYSPRRIAFSVMKKVLPPTMFEQIRTWRRQRRARSGN